MGEIYKLKHTGLEVDNSIDYIKSIPNYIEELENRIDSFKNYDDSELRNLIQEKQDKGNYLTEHQDISGKAEKSELENLLKRVVLLEKKLFLQEIVLSSAGSTVKVENDIQLSEQPLELDKEIILDLQGSTITGGIFTESKGNIISGNTDSYVILAKKGADVTIMGNGSLISQEAEYSMAVWANGGVVTIKGGKFYNAGDGCDLIYASSGGKVYIYGGEFYATENSGDVPATKNKYSALNIKDSDRATSEIIVYGGKFYNFDPANNLSEGPGTNFVAPGYKSVEIESGVFEVIKE